MLHRLDPLLHWRGALLCHIFCQTILISSIHICALGCTAMSPGFHHRPSVYLSAMVLMGKRRFLQTPFAMSHSQLHSSRISLSAFLALLGDSDTVKSVVVFPNSKAFVAWRVHRSCAPLVLRASKTIFTHDLTEHAQRFLHGLRELASGVL